MSQREQLTRSARGHSALFATAIALCVSALALMTSPSGRLPEAGNVATLFIPASAHSAGANGASWRTDVELHNPGNTPATFTVSLLKRDADNTYPETRAYSLEPQRSVRYPDVLMALFGFSGAAALRVDVSTGSLTATSRTYNQVGPNPWNLPEGASFGQFVPGFSSDLAIAYGQEGRLIQLTQRDSSSLDGFRTNLGLVNVTGSLLESTVDLYRADGTWLGRKQGGDTSLPPYGFRQINEVLGPWGPIADGYAVVRPVTPGGKLFAFATVIDNHYSGDPIFVPAARLSTATASPTSTATRPSATATSGIPPTPTWTQAAATQTPTRTPTSTTTPSGSLPNLFLYKPSGWPGCVSANYRDSCCPPSTELLSSYMDTWVFVAVANSGAARVTGAVKLGLYLDGVLKGTATWANEGGLDPGYYQPLSWRHTGEIPPGPHQLTVKADSDGAIAESNEGDNACSFTGEWTSIVFARPGSPHARVAGLGAFAGEVREGERARLALAEPAVAGTVLYLPAAAHAGGLNGSSWRTDAEVHNAGATQATFTIALLKQGEENSAPPTRTFTLGPQQSVRYVDVLDSVFGFTGAAALRFSSDSAALLVNSRTYNLIGANPWNLPIGSSFGQFVPGLAEDAAIAFGEEGRLVQLTHRNVDSLADFRTNVGIVNVTGLTIDVTIDLFHADGSAIGSVSGTETRLRPYEFRQVNTVMQRFLSWCPDGYAVVRTTTPGGRLFAFATVIDNHYSGDPIFIPAARMAASGPQPSATTTPPVPTATATAAAPTPTRTPGAGSPTPTSTPGGATPTIPPAPTAPLGSADMINRAMRALGTVGAQGLPELDSLIKSLREKGPQALIDLSVTRHPGLVTALPNGILIDFGAGYTHKNGEVSRGRIRVTYTNYVSVNDRITFDYRVEPTAYTVDGRALPVGVISGSGDIRQAADGTLTADVAVAATDPGGASAANGNARFDTKVCKSYPIGGTITTHFGGETRTITFTDKCDGTFGYDGPVNGYYLFVYDLTPGDGDENACWDFSDGDSWPFFLNVLILEGSTLVQDPGFAAMVDPKYRLAASASGWISGDAVFLRSRSAWNEYDDPRLVAHIDVSGTFNGVRTPPPQDAEVDTYYAGPFEETFVTSSPAAPCTTRFTVPGVFAGPCPKPHCAK